MSKLVPPKNCAGKGQTRHRVIKKIRGRFSWAHTLDVADIFFQIVRDLRRLKLRCYTEITEEEDHRCEYDVMQPACRKHFGNLSGRRAVFESHADNGRREK